MVEIETFGLRDRHGLCMSFITELRLGTSTEASAFIGESSFSQCADLEALAPAYDSIPMPLLLKPELILPDVLVDVVNIA